MLPTQKIKALLDELSNSSKEDSKELISKYFQRIAALVSVIKEMQDHLKDYKDIYQLTIDDIDLNCWFEIKNGTIRYEEGVNEKYHLKFLLSKDVLLQIVKLENTPFDAYMKGLIKIRGNISYTIRFRNFINDILEYLTKKTKGFIVKT